MKKILIACILAAVMGLSLVACGNNDKGADASSTADVSTSTSQADDSASGSEADSAADDSASDSEAS